MSIAEKPDDKPDAFDELKKTVTDFADPKTDPEGFVRDLHKYWKDLGGSVAGKPRHSDRFLDERLKSSKTPVRSLTPKLVGKTRIKAEDAERLIRFILTNWPTKDQGDGKGVRYQRLMQASDVDEIVGAVSDYMESLPDSDDVAAPSGALAIPDPETLPPPGRDVTEIFRTTFAEADALFTVATERSLVAQDEKTALIGFRNLMSLLQSIEEQDGKDRPLVWVIDLGRRTFEDLEARLRYMGFKNLQMRFNALHDFDDKSRHERWKWLLSRAAFIVQDVQYDMPVDMRGVRRPAFLAHHISFTALAPIWAASANFRTLYGRELENVDQRSFSVFFNADGWPYDGEYVTEEPQHCRYFGYASFAKDRKPNSERLARGLALPFMGYNYEDAYNTAYTALTDLLGLKNRLPDSGKLSGKHATAQLSYLGFRMMGLEEFMKL